MKKANNKGVSLVEFLIAIAIGAIVLSALTLLVTQSTRNYRLQVATSQVQNDANITLNQMEEAIMESTMITIQNETGEDGVDVAGGNTEYVKLSDNVVYIYDSSSATLYLANDIYKSQSDLSSKASVVCSGMTEFHVKITTGSFVQKDDGTGKMIISGLNSSVRLQTSICVTKGSATRQASRTSSTRNTLGLNQVVVGKSQLSAGNVSVSGISDYVVE